MDTGEQDAGSDAVAQVVLAYPSGSETMGARMHLRPLFITRLANSVPGAALCLFGLPLILDSSLGRWHVPAGLLAILAGMVLAVRGLRMAVSYVDGKVVVRGLFLTRTIPAGAVREVTDWPAVRWCTTGGRPRWTPVTAFMTPGGSLPSIRRHNAKTIQKLRRLLRLR
jgi:hypothetical protein